MGAVNFHTAAKISGKTASHAEEAFQRSVDQALYMHGRGGYTGTIAEKDGFVLLKTFEDDATVDDVYSYIREKTNENEKWGPAYAVIYGPHIHFFGFASE